MYGDIVRFFGEGDPVSRLVFESILKPRRIMPKNPRRGAGRNGREGCCRKNGRSQLVGSGLFTYACAKLV